MVSDGPAYRRDPVRAWLLVGLTIAVMVTVFALLPVTVFGPKHPFLSWTVFIVALVVIAALLLRHMRDAVLDRPGTYPAYALLVLMCLTVLVFAFTYLALARQHGEMSGLVTKLDAIYFTIVTLATVGYGDITATGQSARLVVVLQIVYTFVFLTAAATTLSGRLRSRVSGRAEQTGRHDKGRHDKGK
ncbi:potassium channel family protein [Streptomyces sp. NPDC091292]|uniref:potassium channel family protein n=1 Tax=Streptomyces sp. NPDC091292 TaxID=3365991 RepID=UPI0038247E31